MCDSKKVWGKRAAGILLPVSSLPSPYGIGSFGAAARQWVDFLQQAGQTYWQVLPLGPTGYGNSPYQSFSAFAGNPYFIDLDILCSQGLLTRQECAAADFGSNPQRVDYGALFENRANLLRTAFGRFTNTARLRAFRAANAGWVEDYALFMAVKTQMGLRAWNEWDEDIRLRTPRAMETWGQRLKEDVDYHIFTQMLFYSQWAALKRYANSRGVYIIGDIPIYVAMDSADTWAHSEIFLLDEKKVPTHVAGCPPDAFACDGQLWGNPLYRWDVLAASGYAWWMGRLRANLTMYDALRIDHFRGLESYYAIPYGSASAASGRWCKGPGTQFIGAVNSALGQANIIAEDLGYLTPGVKQLLEKSGYPGMKILQFAFDSREESDYMPYNYDKNSVVFTGTHDNDTVRGWFGSAYPKDVQLALEYMGLNNEEDGNWGFIRIALASAANWAVIPMQDYLNLGSEARLNTPSTVNSGNWCWRMLPGVASAPLAQKIAKLARVYGRSLPSSPAQQEGDKYARV